MDIKYIGAKVGGSKPTKTKTKKHTNNNNNIYLCDFITVSNLYFCIQNNPYNNTQIYMDRIMFSPKRKVIVHHNINPAITFACFIIILWLIFDKYPQYNENLYVKIQTSNGIAVYHHFKWKSNTLLSGEQTVE